VARATKDAPDRDQAMKIKIWLSLLVSMVLLSACVSSTIDEMIFQPSTKMDGRSIVVLGRRHSSDYETEPAFVRCVAKHIASRVNNITVINESRFVDKLYPWFEARTAPLRIGSLENLLRKPNIKQTIVGMDTKYIIWLDGSTETSNKIGSVACSIGIGAAGCFGFGSWKSDANYEATIWNFDELDQVGKISTSTTGQSYMPAVIVPIPIIAPVQNSACEGLANQLLKFLNPKNND